jgi:hypothetical protein
MKTYDPWGSNVSVDERLRLLRGHIATDRPLDLTYLRQLRAHSSTHKQSLVIKVLDAKIRKLNRTLPAPSARQRRNA